MSYILDALKKSEQQRRRGEVPRLQNELPPPSPRKRRLWPVVLVVLALLGGGLAAWWFLGRDDQVPRAQNSSQGKPAAAVTRQRVPVPEPKAVTGNAPEVAIRPTAPARTPQVPTSPPPAEAPVTPAPANPVAPPVTAAPRAAQPVPPAASAAAPAKRGQPTPAVAATAAASEPQPLRRIPLRSELPAGVRSGLPELDLQLHYYTADENRRLVRLNGINLRQGDALGDGLTVAEIRPDGVVLDYRGTRFVLPVKPR